MGDATGEAVPTMESATGPNHVDTLSDVTLHPELSHSHKRNWIVAFIAVQFAVMILHMSSLGFSPMLPAIQKEFGMGYGQMGLFTGMYGLIALTMSVPSGLATTRFGEKRVAVGGLIVSALGLLLLAIAPNFGAAFGARALWLIGYRFAFVNLLTALAVVSPPTFKGMSMGIMGAIMSFASVVGASFGGGLARDFGWRGAMLGFSGTAVLGTIIFCLFYRRGTNAASSMDQPRSGSVHFRGASPGLKSGNPFRTLVVWGLAVLAALCGMGQFAATFFIPSVVESVFKLDVLAAAYIISTGYMAAIVANLLVGYLADHFNRWKVVIGALALMVPVSFAMTTKNLLVFRIAAALVLALGVAITGQVYAIAGEVLGKSRTGEVMGIVSLGAGVSTYVGPQVLGLLRDWTGGFSAGWYLLAAVAGLAAIETLFLWLHSRRREAMQATP